MKVVILAGGAGTRLGGETELYPKPMAEIGGKPILWHIMKFYAHHGYNEFVILLGYKGYVIKEYFANYLLHNSNLKVDLHANSVSYENSISENWKVTLLDTGLHTNTGGRILRAAEYLKGETFLLTYGDGLADVNIPELIDAHKKHGKTLTITAVRPAGRFGLLNMNADNSITDFREKAPEEGWINGGFFVCNPDLFTVIENDQTVFEEEPMKKLIAKNQIMAHRHHGFWKCMDTPRDKKELEEMWQSDKAGWKVWK